MEPQECINNITTLFCVVEFISMLVFFPSHLYHVVLYLYYSFYYNLVWYYETIQI